MRDLGTKSPIKSEILGHFPLESTMFSVLSTRENISVKSPKLTFCLGAVDLLSNIICNHHKLHVTCN